MTILTGSSGLPANETRGRRVERGGSECLLIVAGWLQLAGLKNWQGCRCWDPSGLLSTRVKRETIKDNWEHGHYTAHVVFDLTLTDVLCYSSLNGI